MSAGSTVTDRRAAYPGPLGDDPAELVGLLYDDGPDVEDLWADMSPIQHAIATLRSLR